MPTKRPLRLDPCWIFAVSIWFALFSSRSTLVHAAPEPAALAQRFPGAVPVDPTLVPSHIRRSVGSNGAQASRQEWRSPQPEAIRGVRFNAPTPTTRPKLHAGDRSEAEAQHLDAAEPIEAGGAGFELSPLVIAVTVDGQVHGLERETGQWKWTLHDDGGVALGGTGRGMNYERKRRTSAGAAVGGPLVKSVSRRRRTATATVRGSASNETGVVPAADDDSEPDDETYIIEPTGDGDIYVYSRTSGGLDKLPLSMQELVNLSPFRFPGDSSRMFSASKNTKFVGVDLKTGRLVGIFGSSAGWCEWDEADELTGGAKAQEDCEDDIAMRPQDLLYMARTGAWEESRHAPTCTGAHKDCPCRVSPLDL